MSPLGHLEPLVQGPRLGGWREVAVRHSHEEPLLGSLEVSETGSREWQGNDVATPNIKITPVRGGRSHADPLPRAHLAQL